MDYKWIIMSLFIGYIFGLMTGFFLSKKDFTSDKIASLLFASTWLILSVLAFSLDKQLPLLLNIIGAGTAGNITGLNVINLIKSFRGEK